MYREIPRTRGVRHVPSPPIQAHFVPFAIRSGSDTAKTPAETLGACSIITCPRNEWTGHMAMSDKELPPLSRVFFSQAIVSLLILPINLAMAWGMSLIFHGDPRFRDLFYLMVVAAFIDTAVRAVVDHHYSVREDRIAPVGVASFLLGSVATLVVVVALTALLDPRLPPIVSVGTPFLVVGAWRAIDGYRFVHTHDMSDEAIHERDLRMLELNQPTEKVAAPPGRTLRERLANRRAGFRQPLR